MLKNQPHSHRVVIAGGGVAGLEAVLALRALAGERVQITLLDPSTELVDRPMLVARPFAAGHAERHPTAGLLHRAGVTHLRERLESVDTDAHTVRTEGGDELPYDSLVIATGARAMPWLPGASTFAPEDPDALSGLLRDLEEGYSDGVAFVIPPGPVWPLPAYELALMTARESRGMAMKADVWIVTPEERPLRAFGPQASATVGRLLADHHVRVETSASAQPGPVGGPKLLLHPGHRTLDVARVVALPRLAGRPIPGLPSDTQGFLRVDRHCAVRDVPGVYAAGDGANFPIKHGGLSADMADTAAAHIAFRAGADVEPRPFVPELRGTLLTGEGRRSLRHADGRSEVADHMLWWPPAKVAARYLAPALAGEEGEQLLDIDAGSEGLSVRHALDERLTSIGG